MEQKQKLQLQNKLSSEQDTIEIDGSLYEGGGQIIRNSMALSNILQKPFIIQNIRSQRPNPGLNNQLIAAIQLMKDITKAKVTDAKINSQQIYYEPQQKIQFGKYRAGAKTAASISLMLQSILPTLIFAKKESEITLQGGTNVNKAPPAESIQKILLPLLQKFNIQVQYKIVKPGYYPVGNGLGACAMQPIENTIKPISFIKRTAPLNIYIKLILTRNDIKVQDVIRPLKKDMKKFIKSQFQDIDADNDIIFNVDVDHIISKKFQECYAIICHATGDGICLDASYFPDNKAESAEDCAEKVSNNFIKQLQQGGCLDEHHQDQLLIYMALADGESQIRVGKEITPHTEAVFYILKKFVSKAEIKIETDKQDPLQSKIITIKGIGLVNKEDELIQENQKQQ